MTAVKVMISNGKDTNLYRDRAQDVLARVQHMFLYGMQTELYVTEWDYRRDASTLVAAGGVATRSLAMVDYSEALLAILGPTVPKITSQEIRRACERRQRGETVELWTFVNPDQATDRHNRFFSGIKRDFSLEIVWSEYRNELEFQATLFTTLFPYLSQRAGARYPGIGA